MQALLKGASEAKASRESLALEVQTLAQKQVGPFPQKQVESVASSEGSN